jgi:hypothetical protein
MPLPPELVPAAPPLAVLPPSPSIPPAAASPALSSSDSSSVNAGPLQAPIAIATTVPMPKIVVHVARAAISRSSLTKVTRDPNLQRARHFPTCDQVRKLREFGGDRDGGVVGAYEFPEDVCSDHRKRLFRV